MIEYISNFDSGLVILTMYYFSQGGGHRGADTHSFNGLYSECGECCVFGCGFVIPTYKVMPNFKEHLLILKAHFLQMKFVESILSNNTTDDHCQEFVNQKGLLPLVSILGLPNLPIDFPTSAACQAVAGVCKSILVSKRTSLFLFVSQEQHTSSQTNMVHNSKI